MEETIATASKNLFTIKRRRASHLAFRGAQMLFSETEEDISSVLLYPAFDDSEHLANVLNRLAWYLPPNSFGDLEIHVLCSAFSPSISAIDPPVSQHDYEIERLPINTHYLNSIDSIADEADRILVWNKSHRIDRLTLPRLGKVGIVDPSYYSTVEPSTWSHTTNQIRTQVQDSSVENFSLLESQTEDIDTSFVFATGPSLDDVFDIDIPEESLSIICNSIVRNDELLEHLQPDVLVFADPVFHFGPSEYAHKFREDAAAVLNQYDCTAVIPTQYQSLLVSHYPELSDQIIGIDSVPSDTPIYPTSDGLNVMGTSNIMTLFMLPIAMSLTDDIRIVGADGRKQEESYFWEHSETAQYDDELMETVADTHPSFFRDRVYEDYYDQHVETLSEMIEHGESDGKQFKNLTNSYIPCLTKRRVNPDNLYSSAGDQPET